MSRPQNKPLPPAAKLNFLLGASDKDLDSFQLARLAEVANLRSDLHAILDKLIDEMAQAAVAGWFRQADLGTLKLAVKAQENPEARIAEIEAWAKERIKNGQRSDAELVPRTLLPPGSAHIAAALRYTERNIAEGKCGVCPKPLARNSVRYCERHLEIARLRKPPKGAKGSLPGSVDWLYGDGVFESAHGKAPSQVKALKEANEKRAKDAKKDREQ
jgi:hypothetical protein